MASTGLLTAVRFAWRELRAGTSVFRVLVLCLILGTGSLASVATTNRAIEDGLAQEARRLLGGDIAIDSLYLPIPANITDALRESGAVLSQSISMRSLALTRGGFALINLSAVDPFYPLVGELTLNQSGYTPSLLAADAQGHFGVVVEPDLLTALSVQVGELIRIGAHEYRIQATIDTQPNAGFSGVRIGPGVTMSLAGFEVSQLAQPGSLIEYQVRARFDSQPVVAVETVQAQLPGAQVRGLRDASAQTRQIIERVALFMVLASLATLLVAGVGIGLTVTAFVNGKLADYALLKSLGAPTRFVLTVAVIHLAFLVGMSLSLALVLGSSVPFILQALDVLPIAVSARIYARELAFCAGLGVLVSAMFATFPLMTATRVAPARLLSAAGDSPNLLPQLSGTSLWRAIVVVASCSVVLTGLVMVTADNITTAAFFLLWAFFAIGALYVCGWGICNAIGAIRRQRSVPFKLACATFRRRGHETTAIFVAFGVGIGLLVALGQIQYAIEQQLARGINESAPEIFLIDIQPEQLAPLQETFDAHPGFQAATLAPMLRGRIISLNDVPVTEFTVPESSAWLLDADRGMTWSATAPTSGSRIALGQWWPEDYVSTFDPSAPVSTLESPLLVSLPMQLHTELGVNLGDTITVLVVGREISAVVANFRQIDWAGFQMNFSMVFSPGVLDKAPHTWLASIFIAREQVAPLEKTLVEKFSNMTPIRTGAVISQAGRLITQLQRAVAAIAALALGAGILVLIGTVMANTRIRSYETIVLKVLGITPRQLLLASVWEYLMLGGFAAILAIALGVGGASAVITQIFGAEFVLDLGRIATTVTAVLGLSLTFGLLSTRNRLAQRSGYWLRNS